MKMSQVNKLNTGVYTVEWKDGGYSMVMVGIDKDGSRWIAAVNWCSGSAHGKHAVKMWNNVKRIELFCTAD